MTLQYRIRAKFEDRIWRERIRLCQVLITQAADSWCLGDSDFPTEQVVAGILYLFSKRCYPGSVKELQLFQHLVDQVGPPIDEYTSSWPKRDLTAARDLMQAIIIILEESVHVWEEQSFQEMPFETVVERIVDEIVKQQYVVFHHKETTSRDVNHWGI